MAAQYNDHMTEVEDDRLSSVSVATTCFGGFDDNVHVNELRAMRKAINVYRRRLIPSQRMIENASPEVFEDESPDQNHLRATFGKMVCQYIGINPFSRPSKDSNRENEPIGKGLSIHQFTLAKRFKLDKD